MTTRHKALLIGASDYDEPGISSLPFIRDDLQRLATALTDRGFHSAEIAERRRGITLNFVKDQVSRFLREARGDDTLFILLSGHGQHFQGTDYLIPEDASFQVHPFADSCVPLDWGKQLNECAAAQVVFLIDACREGIEQDSMGPVSIAEWSRRKREAARHRKVAYVYACSPGQLALFVRETETVRDGSDVNTTPGESFSLFSRAVADVVSEQQHAMHLGEFEEALQSRLSELHTAYGKSKRLQIVRVLTDTAKPEFPVLSGPARDAGQHPWLRAVTTHPAWDRITPALGGARDALKEVCCALVGRLAEVYETAAVSALREDPWHDRDLAVRAHDRMGFLLTLAEKVRLSPTEAALVSLLPFVSQAFWAQEAARRIAALTSYNGERTPEGGSFHAFVQRYPRLDRRLRRLRQTGSTDDSAQQILWWLYHRWLIQQPDIYAPQSLKELLETATSGSERPRWLPEALSGERLVRFIKDQRTSPFAAPLTGDLADHEPIATTTMHEHEVRESLVSCLAKAAHALAVDPVDLPEVVAEHLGISDSVDLTGLLTTLRDSQWRASGAGRALTAVCQHPAVEISLQEHAQRVDSLFRDINQSAAKRGHTLAPLGTLPPYANSGGVRPSGKAPANLSSGIRFHLAEDRVQELLMGEELYGDRGLAVRELYQNALDACRYREARTTYLQRTHQPVEDWEGLIEFVQGIDEAGRPYLECRDNGIGMGVNELSRTFSQGGARFVDLPEYVEEAADWAELDPPVELFPKSRFGVGVLSYFMLSDEITVHTCRLDRQGVPGRLLKITIAGPGNLFRIEDEGPGQWAGTRVRLHLTAGAARRSGLDTLSEVLWVAPYRTRAVHGSRTQEWEPGVLRADLAAVYSDPFHGEGTRLGRTFPSSKRDLWWSENIGIVLADGLLANDKTVSYVRPLQGAIVNLYGRHRPELSVDRRQLRGYDSQHVDAMMRAALPSLSGDALSLVTREWLENVSRNTPAFADGVTRQAGASGATWSADGHELPVDSVGFFPPDTMLLSVISGEYSDSSDPYTGWSRLVRLLPAPVLRWRLLALYATGVGGALGAGFPGASGIPAAVPSDLRLLSPNAEGSVFSWSLSHSPNSLWPEGLRTTLVETGWPFLHELFRWRTPRVAVTAAEIFSCVAATGRPAADVMTRLSQLGYQTPPLSDMAATTVDDIELLRPLGNHQGWLSPGAALSVAQISYSAAKADCAPADAATRLRQLGYQVPDHTYGATPWSPEDSELLATLWGRDRKPVPVAQAHEICKARIVTAAFNANRSIGAVIQLLSEAGFTVPAEASQLDISDADDGVLLSDGLPITHAVPKGQLAALALHLGRSVSDVAERLIKLGFHTPDPLPTPGMATWEDAELFRSWHFYPHGWLPEDTPVDVFTLARMVRFRGDSISAVATWLASLGYTILPDSSLLETLDTTDVDLLDRNYHRPRSVTVPGDQLYVAAQLTGSTMETVADKLALLGLDVEPLTDDLVTDIAMEKELSGALSSEIVGTEPTPRRPSIGWISLPALASAAMLHRTTLRETALLATQLGMTHEAEDWFE